jgi:membrane protein DedA with SNARE-associated domain
MFNLEKLLSGLISLFTEHGYAAVFSVLILCGFGLPVPEDVSLVSGGVISGLVDANGNPLANVHLMFLTGMLGVLIGDCSVFLLGSFYGERIRNTWFFQKYVPPKKFEVVQEKFTQYGNWVIFFGRFMPGLRMPIYLTAGITHRVSLARFFFTDGLAALISVPIWIYLGHFFALEFENLITTIQSTQRMVFLTIGGILLLVFVFYKLKKRKDEF